jgi:hypothetical protein
MVLELEELLGRMEALELITECLEAAPEHDVSGNTRSELNTKPSVQPGNPTAINDATCDAQHGLRAATWHSHYL